MQIPLPANTLLSRYAVSESGAPLPHYTDCFTVTVPGTVDLSGYVKSFYTTPLFRSERLILRLFGMPSSDADIDALLAGQQQHFAAWTLEDRTDDELLMCDAGQRTRSWFRVVHEEEGTRLYFGSAVLARGEQIPGSYRALFSAHRFYSRRLLHAAARRIAKRGT